MVVVPAMAAGIDHGVDGRGPAKDAAARLIPAPPAKAGLRLGLERPIVQPRGDHQQTRNGCPDDPAVAHSASFQESNRDIRVFAQAGGDNTAAGPTPNYNIVGVVHGRVPIPPYMSQRRAPMI